MVKNDILILIDQNQYQQMIMDCISTNEIDRYFNNTVFKDDANCKQAMIHGMCIASMMTSKCNPMVIDMTSHNTGFTKTFPYNTGTFVVVNTENVDPNKPITLLGHLGTIACYQSVDEDDELIAMVSGYKDAWCGEFLLNEIRLATDEEIAAYKRIKGIKD